LSNASDKRLPGWPAGFAIVGDGLGREMELNATPW